MDITSERNVTGMDITSERNIKRTDITCECKVQGTDIRSERNVQWTHIRSERNVQWTHIRSERNVIGTNITSELNVQGTDTIFEKCTDSCLQDEDHTEGHYITWFTEQLTRPFELLVSKKIRTSDLGLWTQANYIIQVCVREGLDNLWKLYVCMTLYVNPYSNINLGV